jgi:hypothetical protein
MHSVKRLPTYTLIFVLMLGVTSLFSCEKIAEVPAPSVSPEQTAPPAISPSILGVEAYLIINDGVITRDVDFSLNQPAYFVALDWAGDYIFYLDVTPPFTPDQPATTAEGTYQSIGYDNFVSWKNLTTGKHIFWAQLVKPDMTPLNPPVDASLEIDVPSPGTDKPFIRSLSVQMLCQPGYTPPDMPSRPKDASACADINVITDVLNFKVFADKIGQPSAPGEGHFIYYFNVTPPMTPGKPALTEEGTYAITADSITSWLGVLPGEYLVWVQLVNNDNTPLEPPVVAGGSIIVPVDAERYY